MFGGDRNSSFLGFRTHSEFTNGICDIFASQTYIQDGHEIHQANWKCSPICLNSLFCPYCVLSRQAHAIYLEEAHAFFDHQRLNSNHSLGITSNNNPVDFNHVPVISSRSQHDDDDAASSRTGGAASSTAESHQRRRQPIQNQSSTLTFGGSTIAGGVAAGNSNNNGGDQNNNNNRNNNNNFDFQQQQNGSSNVVDDDDNSNSFCPCLPRSCRTCLPRCQVYLDTTLPSALHWTCLSAVAIDITNFVVGGFFPVTLAGLWATGLTMQAILTRHLVRRRLGLAPETTQDVLVTVFLPCCAAGQQHMEMELRGHRSGLSDFDGLVCGHWVAPPRRGIDSVIY